MVKTKENLKKTNDLEYECYENLELSPPQTQSNKQNACTVKKPKIPGFQRLAGLAGWPGWPGWLAWLAGLLGWPTSPRSKQFCFFVWTVHAFFDFVFA